MFGMSRKFGDALRVAAIAVSALALGGIMAGPSLAEEKLVILGSVPGLKFPFFVHMMNQIKAEGEKLGVEVIVGDGQVSSTKQTADVEAAIPQIGRASCRERVQVAVVDVFWEKKHYATCSAEILVHATAN